MRRLKSLNLGFIGLGAMGSRMAANLLRAGYRVKGYDIRRKAVRAHVSSGGTAAGNAREIVRDCDIVMTSLVSHAYLKVAKSHLVPGARRGQIFIDFSTVPAPQTRRLGKAFKKKGAVAIDSPVSGWWTGARDGALRVFIGGPKAAVARCRPLFAVVGNPRDTHYAGSASMGQVMKVVQQLRERLLDAARMEVMAFGVRGGLTLKQVMKGMGVDPAGPDAYARIYRTIKSGRGDELACLFGEWAYYLEEARAKRFRMPALESLHRFCAPGKRVNRDEQGRVGPSIWRELMRRRLTRALPAYAR